MTFSTKAHRVTAEATRASALTALLGQFFRYLSDGDTDAAAALWDVPALILGDEVVHGPLSRDRLASELADTPECGDPEPTPRTDGVLPAEPLIKRVEWTSQRVALVEARWPRRTYGGLLRDVDTTTFLVRIDELGQLKIRGLVLHAAVAGPAAAL